MLETVTWAHENGIVHGYSVGDGGMFGPDDPITREQVAQLLYNYNYAVNFKDFAIIFDELF